MDTVLSVVLIGGALSIAYAPGDILTPMRSGGLAPAEMSANLQAINQSPARGARDVAGAALFFASDDAEWVTGVVLEVDGGSTSGDGSLGDTIPKSPVLE